MKILQNHMFEQSCICIRIWINHSENIMENVPLSKHLA